MCFLFAMTATEAPTNDPRLAKALQQLHSAMIAEETLEAWSAQRRIFALSHRRVLIAATSGRFIALARRLFSGYDMTDLRWQDLHDARLRMGMLGADLTLNASGMSDLVEGGSVPRTLTYLGFAKEQTAEVYRFCQEHEQAWREKRRVRELEEMRAQSGGVQIGSTTGGAGMIGAAAGGDPVARLQQAKQMLDAKLISDSEYEALKAKIIGGV